MHTRHIQPVFASSVRRIFAASALTAGICISGSAFGQVLVTENFNSDPGWDGSFNRANGPGSGGSFADDARNNFGFSDTDNTGASVAPPVGAATGAGELGGVVGATIDAYYADTVGLGGGGNLTLDGPLHFSGVLRLESNNQQTLFGFLNSASGTFSDGRRTQFLGFQTVARNPFHGQAQRLAIVLGGEAGEGAQLVRDAFDPEANPGGVTSDSSNTIQIGTTYPFSLDYDPAGGDFGSITLAVGGGVISNDSTPLDGSYTVDLSEEQRNSNISFDRFGLATSALFSDRGPETVFYDDLTYTKVGVIPEPASLGLLAVSGVLGLRRARRCH